MKTLLTILTFIFCLGGIMAQNADGPGRAIPQKTPELKALYAQQHNLKTAGDVVGLENNRQAIIAAWQDTDPTIAAEFRPNQIIPKEYLVAKPKINALNTINAENKLLWGNDLELYSGFVDGVDIDTALDGTIYIATYENRFRYGLGTDIITIYKSTDNGISFSTISGIDIDGDDITKIKLTIMDKGAEKGLFVTLRTADGFLLNSRMDMDGVPPGWLLEVIAEDVKEFDIAVDYEFEATAQLYAVYTKTNGDLHAARTATNGFGVSWGDDHYLGYVAKECAITYGKGNTFMSFVGLNSGNLYFASNFGYNDPTGWDTAIIITDGAIEESKEISLSAERKDYSEYRALVLACQKAVGSGEDILGTAIVIEGGTFTVNDIVGGNVHAWDTWSKKEDGNKIIRTSYETMDEDMFYTKYYDDAVWENYSKIVSDNSITVQRGSSAVAEDVDRNTIAVYIGADRTGLYFDSSNNTAGISDYALSSFTYYPNPTNNILTLKSESAINNVAIFNLLGQQVLTQNLETLSTDLDVSSLSSGTYVMKVSIGSETGSYKIIKN